MNPRLGTVDRIIAGVLAVVWISAGATGLIVAWSQQQWVIGVSAVLAFGFAALWLKAALHGRLLTWRPRARRRIP